MTNEELVERVQAGERDTLPVLWAQVERFVASQARRRLILSGGLGGVEFGDLYDSGYIALVAAADTYDPAAGCSFIAALISKGDFTREPCEEFQLFLGKDFSLHFPSSLNFCAFDPHRPVGMADMENVLDIVVLLEINHD